MMNKQSIPTAINKNAPYSVLLIAEQGTVSKHFDSALSGIADIDLVAYHTNGIDGVSFLRKRHIDVIIIDIGMRQEDPLLTLKRILRIDSHARVVMVSTLSFANVRQSMKGFELGAAELIHTPSDFTRKSSTEEFDLEVLRAVRSLAEARRLDTPRAAPPSLNLKKPSDKDLVLRPASDQRPQVLAIGSSTGGPNALTCVLKGLPSNFSIPVFITQHMPKTFTAALAISLSKSTGKTVVEAEDGMPVSRGSIYLAPGDFHMTITGTRQNQVISLNQDPKINYCRPSVDPMLKSIVTIFGSATLVLILTGMGSDGKNGAEMAVQAKGTVIAQDLASSVVWGMPRAVAMAGLCSHVLPVDGIPAAINKLVSP